MSSNPPGPDLRVALLQHAASLDPAENRDAVARLVPGGHDLVVLPEASARDFGTPGSSLAEHAEDVTRLRRRLSEWQKQLDDPNPYELGV